MGHDDDATRGGAASQVEDLLLDRTFDGVVRYCCARHSDVLEVVVEDAVLIVVARLIANDHAAKKQIFYYLVRGVDREIATQMRQPRRETLIHHLHGRGPAAAINAYVPHRRDVGRECRDASSGRNPSRCAGGDAATAGRSGLTERYRRFGQAARIWLLGRHRRGRSSCG